MQEHPYRPCIDNYIQCDGSQTLDFVGYSDVDQEDVERNDKVSELQKRRRYQCQCCGGDIGQKEQESERRSRNDKAYPSACHVNRHKQVTNTPVPLIKLSPQVEAIMTVVSQ